MAILGCATCQARGVGGGYLAEIDLEHTAAHHAVHLLQPLLLLEQQLPELHVELPEQRRAHGTAWDGWRAIYPPHQIMFRSVWWRFKWISDCLGASSTFPRMKMMVLGRHRSPRIIISSSFRKSFLGGLNGY